MTPRSLIHLLRDASGTMAIETAIVAPVLAMMAIGVFEVGTLVSRQQELQSSASEAEGIILAAAAGASTDSAKIEEIIEHSLNLGPDQVTLEERFRCDAAETMTDDETTCDAEKPVYRYVLLQVTDTYTPVWTWFGSKPHTYNVERTVQVR
jgi:Flp pilus assembly protein TadG